MRVRPRVSFRVVVIVEVIDEVRFRVALLISLE